jgi:hypothetical protein
VRDRDVAWVGLHPASSSQVEQNRPRMSAEGFEKKVRL